jgi:hypothetical protein
MGSLEGIFISNPETVEKIFGKTIFFGEVLGKHSDIFCIIDSTDIKILNVRDSTVDDLLTAVATSSQIYYTVSGINPLDYFENEE